MKQNINKRVVHWILNLWGNDKDRSWNDIRTTKNGNEILEKAEVKGNECWHGVVAQTQTSDLRQN